MQVGRARHTCVLIADVEAARVAGIPIGKMFDDIGVRGLDVFLCSWGHAGMTASEVQRR